METLIQETSSIGAMWPPTETTHHRMHGFYTEEVICDQQSAATLGAHVDHALGRMDLSDTASRLSVRAVAKLNVLASLEYPATAIEAVLPIAGTDLGVVYIGANKPDRFVPAERIEAHARVLESAAASPISPTHSHVFERDGITARLVDPTDTASILDSFAELYRAFNYDETQTEAILSSSENIIAYAELGGLVVSTAMAESATISIKGFGDLKLVEITEASTHPDYRRRGLYSAISGFLIQQLIQMRRDNKNPIDVLYGESNLATPGVLYAARQNGRRFSFFDRQRFGANNPAFGILPQNFKVNDGTETRAYNDFAVSYIPL